MDNLTTCMYGPPHRLSSSLTASNVTYMPLLHSQCIYVTFLGSLQALSCLYNNLNTSTSNPTTSTSTLMTSTVRAFSSWPGISSFAFYKHYLTTAVHTLSQVLQHSPSFYWCFRDLYCHSHSLYLHSHGPYWHFHGLYYTATAYIGILSASPTALKTISRHLQYRHAHSLYKQAHSTFMASWPLQHPHSL